MVILSVAAGMSLLTYFLKGEPQRYLKLDQVNATQAQEGEISIETLMSEKAEVLWIDARTRNEWKYNGVKGSLFISSDPREDIDQLIEDCMEQLFEADQSKILVVVYCNQVECVDSKSVIESIQRAGFELNIFRLVGGYSSLYREPRVSKKGGS